MTVDVLGNRVNNNIGTVVKRVLNVGTHKSVVDNDQDSMTVSDISNGLDINQAEGRVGRSFDPNELSLIRTNQILNVKLNGR